MSQKTDNWFMNQPEEVRKKINGLVDNLYRQLIDTRSGIQEHLCGLIMDIQNPSKPKAKKAVVEKTKQTSAPVYLWSDPHSGIGGAAVPLPAKVKKAIDKLNGKETTLEKAIADIKKAAGPTADVEFTNNFLKLTIGSLNNGAVHMWRLLTGSDNRPCGYCGKKNCKLTCDEYASHSYG